MQDFGVCHPVALALQRAALAAVTSKRQAAAVRMCGRRACHCGQRGQHEGMHDVLQRLHGVATCTDAVPLFNTGACSAGM